MAKKKQKSLFDLLGCIFDKTPWESLSETEKKAFSPYMINRFISMDQNYTGIINYLQRYSIGILRPKDVYKLYQSIFPKQRGFYSKYIKKSKTSDFDLNDNLIKFVADNDHRSTDECRENLQLLLSMPIGKDIVKEYLTRYGVDSATMKKVYGL